eukprot:364744-Chlamydomonas_euryale.AAC.9
MGGAIVEQAKRRAEGEAGLTSRWVGWCGPGVLGVGWVEDKSQRHADLPCWLGVWIFWHAVCCQKIPLPENVSMLPGSSLALFARHTRLKAHNRTPSYTPPHTTAHPRIHHLTQPQTTAPRMSTHACRALQQHTRPP